MAWLTGGCAAAVLAACTQGSTAPDLSGLASGTAAVTTTTVLPTPVTPDGLVTGPGVTDQTIAIGLIVDSGRDRGFSAGVRLWQQGVNASGGLCGRTIALVTAGPVVDQASASAAYDAIGRSTVGLMTLASEEESRQLTLAVVSDQVPTLTPDGASSQLGPGKPIVIGPTTDILAINGLDYLLQTDRVAGGGTIGVLTDGSAIADNAVAGARWWAADRGLTLDIRNTADGGGLAGWGTTKAVLALTDPAMTAALLDASPSGVTVLTTIDGYDPTNWDSGARAAASAGRLLISSGNPAYQSDYPAAVAVAARAGSSGVQGPRLFDGYATGASWARLLTQSCADRDLTRRSLQQATLSVGPALVDSLFGPTDPGLPGRSSRPATRVSAMSAANPAAPSGLTPLTWPQGAAGIENYLS